MQITDSYNFILFWDHKEKVEKNRNVAIIIENCKSRPNANVAIQEIFFTEKKFVV